VVLLMIFSIKPGERTHPIARCSHTGATLSAPL
jgi:hypothetical protein